MEGAVRGPSSRKRTAVGSCREVFCGHCDMKVPRSTFYRHRENFFDEIRQEWLPQQQTSTSTDETVEADKRASSS